MNLQSTMFKYLLKLLFQENSQTKLMQKHWKMVCPVTLDVWFGCFVMSSYLLYTRVVIWDVSMQMRPGCHHWSICELNPWIVWSVKWLQMYMYTVEVRVHVDYTIFSFSITQLQVLPRSSIRQKLQLKMLTLSESHGMRLSRKTKMVSY